jgi:hypothetical protein
MSKIFRLVKEVRFKPPRAWSVQARYAFVYSKGEPFVAAPGRLVIYLGPRRFFDGQEDQIEHLYRLSDGRAGVLAVPPDGRFKPEEDREIIALATQVRSLPEMLAEKGLALETISRLDPFALITCPLCRGVEFTTLDFASVWCDWCNTQFTTRMTAGDPGVVVDANPANYRYTDARYIVPHHELTMTVVLKDFGYSSHPEGKCGDWCVNGTACDERAERGYFVSNPTSLQDNTHWCGLEVYDWSLYGRATEPEHWSERGLRAIVGDSEAAGRIYGKMVRSERLPSVDLLDEGEPDGEGREWWYLADVLYRNDVPWWPIWWKVTPKLVSDDHDCKTIDGWIVTDRALCPGCLKCGSEGDHRYCDWDEMGWEPE